MSSRLYIAGIMGETESREHQIFANMSDRADSTSDSPQAVVTVRGEFRDFDEVIGAAMGWGLDWIQLDRGPFAARIQQVGTSSALISRFGFSRKFHQRGTIPPGMRSFGMIAPKSPPIEWRGIAGTPDHLIAFPSNDDFDFVSHPGFCGDTMSAPEPRIRRVAEVLGLPDPLAGAEEGRVLTRSDPRSIELLRRGLSRIHALGFDSGESGRRAPAVADVEFDVIAALVRILNSDDRAGQRVPEPCLRARALRRALSYIEEHAAEAPTVEEVCRASGASWRTLNYAFRDQFDLTPKQYLQAVRLQQVRLDLLKTPADTTILEIAANRGFWHMGQFAKVYRRQFGELPSETARRD